jgi:hypothetical protein
MIQLYDLVKKSAALMEHQNYSPVFTEGVAVKGGDMDQESTNPPPVDHPFLLWSLLGMVHA